jgi:hypothetical protein
MLFQEITTSQASGSPEALSFIAVAQRLSICIHMDKPFTVTLTVTLGK